MSLKEHVANTFQQVDEKLISPYIYKLAKDTTDNVYMLSVYKREHGGSNLYSDTLQTVQFLSKDKLCSQYSNIFIGCH
jgi:hypothetical protein